MGGEEVEFEGVVLRRAVHGERWLKLDVLSADGGHPLVLVRAPSATGRRKPAGGVPDLFARVRFRVRRAGTDGPPIANAADVVTDRRALARSLEALEEASHLARFLARHQRHFPEPALVLSQFEEALDAWEAGKPPAAVGLKALWRFCRAEGLPVKEDWLAGLGDGERRVATAVLVAPSEASAEVPAEAIRSIAEDLAAWVDRQL